MAQAIAADPPGASGRAPPARPASAAGAGSAFAAVIGPRTGAAAAGRAADSAGADPEIDDHARDAAEAAPPGALPPTAAADRERSRPRAAGAASADPSQQGPGPERKAQPPPETDRAPAPAPTGTDGARGPRAAAPAGAPVHGEGEHPTASSAALPPRGKTIGTVARPGAGADPLVSGDQPPAGPATERALAARSMAASSARAHKAGPPPALQPLPVAHRTGPGEPTPRISASSRRGTAGHGAGESAIAGATLQAAAPAPPPAAMPAPAPPLPPAAIIAQITRAANTAAPAMIEITLQPRELGRLRLVLRPEQGSDEIRVSLGAERAETLDLLRRHAGMLEGALRDLGFARPRLDFTALSTDDPARAGAGAGADDAGGRGEGDAGGRAGSGQPGADPSPAVPVATGAAPRRPRGWERLDIRL